ncbi:MAG TPA: DUF4159 domain-containing protein [Afifellaceae bacterium]|nr:DUF4159 domain-containing protein [Afifellaceae bacterium]
MSGLAFLSPMMLLGLAILPVIWLILRLTPPRPTMVDFPPTQILIGLEEEENTPARTPWWLTALRLLLAALLIVALAQPVFRPDEQVTSGDGPLLVLIDNGWDSAPDFELRREAAEAVIESAARADRPVALVASAESRSETMVPGSPEAAIDRLAAIEPRPYLADRLGLAQVLANAYPAGSAEVLWLAGPLGDGDAATLAAALQRIGGDATTFMSSGRPLSVLRPPRNGVDSLSVPVVRIGGPETVTLSGFDSDNRQVIEETVSLAGDETTEVEIGLPADLRNALTRFTVAGEESTGAVQLLDGRWRRKTVGLIAGEAGDVSQPLLTPLTYVERALADRADLIVPYARSTAEALDILIKRNASMIVLTDTGNLPPETTDAVDKWVSEGGTLLRFASPRLGAGDERLLPMRLREGERAFGGSLSWQEPQRIGAFSETGPFRDIEVPADIRVTRQILADPSALDQVEVWAELADGTPLVTARQHDQGRLILFHVTADPRWSNLPLSGAFVEMLTSISETATATLGGKVDGIEGGEATAGQPAVTPWKAVQVLDGYGKLGKPGDGVSLIADFRTVKPGAETPPGIYDRGGTLQALNAVSADTELAPLNASTIGWAGAERIIQPRTEIPVWPWILAAAALLAALDGLAILALTGRLVPARAAATAAGFVLLLAAGSMVFPPSPAMAQQAGEADDSQTAAALEATLSTHIAYVLSGDPLVDETSLSGLSGLNQYIASRTALEPGEPIGVDLASDELAFFALIYWPIAPDSQVPPADVMAKVDSFLKNGGTILFDTRDAGQPTIPGGFSNTPENQKLRQILSFIDVPPLEPVPPDHVLTKAFYLLAEFPGRWRDSDLWVEALTESRQDPNRPARGGDGVSPIIITGNDFASAWATGPDGRFLYPTVPADPRQRELSFRSGVNIVMYTLTGNYKADQVHVPALLERLGQ